MPFMTLSFKTFGACVLQWLILNKTGKLLKQLFLLDSHSPYRLARRCCT
jgi:hypothetical protein